MDSIFGGTVLAEAHFNSDLAKSVFNDDKAQVSNSLRTGAERRVLEWLQNASPKTILRFSRGLDRLVVPALSPPAFRAFCSILCENAPQVIANMPNTKESVTALAKAVHLSKFANTAAINRIAQALAKEGLSA